MSTRGELMASGMPGLQATQIGQHPLLNQKATGSTKATALALNGGSLVVFTTVSSGTGCLLPAAVGAPAVVIYNGGSNALAVYSTGTDVINALTANASFSVTNGKAALFFPAGVNWVANLSA